MAPTTGWIDALDLHVAGIAAIPLVLAAVLPWGWVPWLVALLPLGRLATRASDLRRAGRSPWPHLLANGLLVLLATTLGFLLSPGA